MALSRLRAFPSRPELVRAVTIQRDSLIDLCLIEHVDPNGRDAQGRTPLLIAASQRDWKTAQRLIDAGALVDLADKNGFTPLMAAAMRGNLEMFRSLLAHSVDLHAEAPCKDGRDLLGMAIDGGNSEIVNAVTERLPVMPQWTPAHRALDAALLAENKDKSFLLGKHARLPRRKAKAFRFSPIPSRETIPPCSARFWLAEPILTLFFQRVVIRIFWRCCHRNRFAATWKKTGTLPL